MCVCVWERERERESDVHFHPPPPPPSASPQENNIVAAWEVLRWQLTCPFVPDMSICTWRVHLYLTCSFVPDVYICTRYSVPEVGRWKGWAARGLVLLLAQLCQSVDMNWQSYFFKQHAQAVEVYLVGLCVGLKGSNTWCIRGGWQASTITVCYQQTQQQIDMRRLTDRETLWIFWIFFILERERGRLRWSSWKMFSMACCIVLCFSMMVNKYSSIWTVVLCFRRSVSLQIFNCVP